MGRRSDSLYYDNVSRRELCDRVAHLESDLEDAKGRGENAKLRNLVHILCHCMQIHSECDDCRLNGAKGKLAFDPLCACDGLHELLRELGIEVGE